MATKSKILVIILAVSCYFPTCDVSKNEVLQAKRSLVEREKEFLRDQPMSDALKSFIDKYRSRRKKRSQPLNENLLYIIRDGQLMPFKEKEYEKRNTEDKTSFRVVPLVIPVEPKLSKMLKIRDLNQEMQTAGAATVAPLVVPEAAAAPAGNPVAQIAPQLDGVPAASEVAAAPAEAPAAPAPSEAASNPSSPPSGSANQGEVTSDEELKNQTIEETKVLQKILTNVETLMDSKSNDNRREGMLCNLSGSWNSDAAGMRFDVTFKPQTRKKFKIHLAERLPPHDEGFLCDDDDWSVFGELPFQHSGVIVVLAVHQKDKHIAMFIGECRVCDGGETVTGTWLIGRSSRDCKDQKEAHKILSDVWKKENTHTLQKKHLQELGITVKDEDWNQ